MISRSLWPQMVVSARSPAPLSPLLGVLSRKSSALKANWPTGQLANWPTGQLKALVALLTESRGPIKTSEKKNDPPTQTKKRVTGCRASRRGTSKPKPKRTRRRRLQGRGSPTLPRLGPWMLKKSLQGCLHSQPFCVPQVGGARWLGG